MMLRSALFNVVFWIVTFLFGSAEIVVALISRKYAFYVPRAWTRVNLWFLSLLCNIRHEVRGAEFIPQGAALIASKHQSAWDTLIFWIVLEKPTFVLKRSLIYIPVFGWVLLLLKSIYIDRKSGAGAMKRMLRETKTRLQEGCAVIIFPEGTRTIPATETTYHPGIAALYQNLNLPVTPVALNSGLRWGRNSFIKKPGLITIEFLPAIPAGMKGRDFLPLLKERIEAASLELIEQNVQVT